MGNTVDQQLVRKALAGDRRSLGRILSAIENDTEEGREYLQMLYPLGGRAQIIGITGPAGAGKSTLVDRICGELTSQGKRIAILAVDPSSPLNGGALLGDRIRMTTSSEQAGVFIRSMASRGALGGLAPAAGQVLLALDGLGFDVILLETVGVGQGEVDVVSHADTVLVVLVPGMGDGIQAMKAGILEVADIFVINKADYSGADRLYKELKSLIELGGKSDWETPIVSTIALEGKGVPELAALCKRHREETTKSGNQESRYLRRLEKLLKNEMATEFLRAVEEQPDYQRWREEVRKILASRKKDPLGLAREFLSLRVSFKKFL